MPKVRVTLSLDDQAVSMFKEAAEIEASSLSAVVNAWLLEVGPSAVEMAKRERDDYQARRLMLKQAMVIAAASGEAESVVARVRDGSKESLLARDVAATPGRPPRLVIRGVNSPERTKGARRA